MSNGDMLTSFNLSLYVRHKQDGLGGKRKWGLGVVHMGEMRFGDWGINRMG